MTKQIKYIFHLIEVLLTHPSERAKRGRTLIKWHLLLQGLMLIMLYYQLNSFYILLFIIFLLITYQIIVDGMKCVNEKYKL